MSERSPNPNGPDGPAGRDGRGRFSKGNTCAQGHSNPFARRRAHLLKVMQRDMSDRRFLEIWGAVVEQAAAGSLPATELVFKYLLGPPLPATNPDYVLLDSVKIAALLEEAGAPENERALMRLADMLRCFRRTRRA